MRGPDPFNARLVGFPARGAECRPDDLLHFAFELPEAEAEAAARFMVLTEAEAARPDRADPSWGHRGFARRGPRPVDRELWIRRDCVERSGAAPLGRALLDALQQREVRRRRWALGTAELALDAHAPLLMGIVNVTPDSFSDGGRWLDPARAVDHGLRLVEEGASLLDVGGESTRPGSEPVSADEELRRVVPVIEGLAAQAGVPLSVDTTKAVVARESLAAGARIVNDTSALEDDPELLGVVATSGAGLVLMHRRGRPSTMQQDPRYAHCRAEVAADLRGRAAAAIAGGVPPDSIVLDPGIGFGKRLGDNLQLVGHVGELRSLGFPVLLGASRKSFLGKITGREAAERDAATAATVAVAYREGIEMVRGHDVAGSRDVLQVLAALSGECAGVR